MGSVFGFVSNDLRAKIEILEGLRRKEDFDSFIKMIEYEKSEGLLSKHDYVSGSRTLLRLHRGLGLSFLKMILSCFVKRAIKIPSTFVIFSFF